MDRRPNFQTIAWFNDLRQRGTLDLDPPYQRRSIWNQSFKDYFVDTVLLNLPAPAIFLYEDISAEGRSVHHVVDGKQRLTTIFEFLDSRFPIADASQLESLRGLYFSNLQAETKKRVWSYVLLVEFVPSDDEEGIKAIFDRINRNVAKLTPQELRHAKLSGEFITATELLAEWFESTMPPNIPRVTQPSRRQMKDVEIVALLLLLTEEGVRGYSQSDLDIAFTERDDTWEERTRVESEFRAVIISLAEVFRPGDGLDVGSTRLRNQADFYSLYGAVLELHREGKLPGASDVRSRLAAFVTSLDGPDVLKDGELSGYLDAARSASNDKGPREKRIELMKRVLLGQR